MYNDKIYLHFLANYSNLQLNTMEKTLEALKFISTPFLDNIKTGKYKIIHTKIIVIINMK